VKRRQNLADTFADTLAPKVSANTGFDPLSFFSAKPAEIEIRFIFNGFSWLGN
jgi:hypothetical protein